MALDEYCLCEKESSRPSRKFSSAPLMHSGGAGPPKLMDRDDFGDSDDDESGDDKVDGVEVLIVY